jgi:hypothetical protein
VALSVQCSSGALIWVSFGRSSLHTTKSSTEGGGLPLFTELPRRRLLGNSISGTTHSRKPSFRFCPLLATHMHTPASPNLFRSVTPLTSVEYFVPTTFCVLAFLSFAVLVGWENGCTAR